MRPGRQYPLELFRDDVLEAVLAALDERFDSHDFIFEMMRRFPREYTNALYECRRAKDPIRTLHAQIGRKLAEMKGRIRKSKMTRSPNARGLPSTNQFWEKIDSGANG